uniref:DNA helicase Pif1-like 2B domain-containing protein n=1 Tax=Octopus bimaculoides TaxID=37653 RepID=A0A0L8HF66_OCTBM
MLLRNLSISQGLCNGTHMKGQILHEHCVEASLVTGSNRGHTVLIPRIKLSPSDANIPFTLNRLQFPLRLPYSITIKLAYICLNQYFLMANYMSHFQEHEL